MGISAKNRHLHDYNNAHQAKVKSHSRQNSIPGPIGTAQGRHDAKNPVCFCGRCFLHSTEQLKGIISMTHVLQNMGRNALRHQDS